MAGFLAVYSPGSYQQVWSAAIGSPWNCNAVCWDGELFWVGSSFYISAYKVDDSGALKNAYFVSSRIVANNIQTVNGICADGDALYIAVAVRNGTPPGPHTYGTGIYKISRNAKRLRQINGTGKGTLGNAEENYQDITFDGRQLTTMRDPNAAGTQYTYDYHPEGGASSLRPTTMSQELRAIAWNGKHHFVVRERSGGLLADVFDLMDRDGNFLKSGGNLNFKTVTGLDFGQFENNRRMGPLGSLNGKYIVTVYN